MEFLEITSSSIECLGISLSSWFPCNSMEFHAIPWTTTFHGSTLNFYGAAWNVMDSMEPRGSAWNSMEFKGGPWNSMEFFEVK